MQRVLVPCAALLACVALPGRAQVEPAPQTVVVTGTAGGRSAFDAPAAVGVVGAEALRASGPLVNLSEALARVPGVVIANRQNYAQDLQISSRGFGARAGFGVRGMRLYTDGIPASMPDGQGQVSHFDLASAQRIEVLRGPFSVLYGNSSGGVIASFGTPVRAANFETALDLGSFGLRQWRVAAAAPLDSGLDVRVGAAGLEWEGFRPHSAARKTTAHARLGWRGAHDRVLVIASTLDQPADDPLGLTRAQFDADERQTTPEATQFDTRKTLSQQQVGARWTHGFGDGSVLREAALMAYVGDRAVTQWLAIPAATQGNPRHGGGVIDFDRRYDGADARLTWRWDEAVLVAGAALERQHDDRRGHLNYSGSVAVPTYGVIGELRRDEGNEAVTRDVYAQLELPLSASVAVSGGVRSGRLRLATGDRYLSNGDDSGARRFGYTNPVLGLRWRAAPGLNLHASVARGFEAPTLGELAYRPDGSGGFNNTLRPQRSRQVEVGAKWRTADDALALDAALFRVSVDDEIGVATNAGGRQSFRNVGRTRRSGAELSLSWRVSPAWRTQWAVTLLDARYRDAFLACAGVPCSAPSVPVPAGNRIAGTQRGLLFGELAWQATPHSALAVEVRAASSLVANDSNTEAAPRYALLAVRAQQRFALPNAFVLELLARLDNATDRRHAASVIVNDANGRHYETGAPRHGWLGLRLSRPL
jgi:iron complex outermembrane receptor protein